MPTMPLTAAEAHQAIEALRGDVRSGRFGKARDQVSKHWDAWRAALNAKGLQPLDRVRMATLSWEVFDAFGDHGKAWEYLSQDELMGDCEDRLRRAVAKPKEFAAEFAKLSETERRERYNFWRQRTFWVLSHGFHYYRRQNLEDALDLLLLAETFLDTCLAREGFPCNGTRARLYYFLGQVRHAEYQFDAAAKVFDRSMHHCCERLKERTDHLPPTDPAYKLEQAFSHYCLGKLELKLGELDSDHGRLGSAKRHAYASRVLLQTAEDPFLRHMAELLLCRIHRFEVRLSRASYTLVDRLEKCCASLQDHPTFAIEAQIERLKTRVYLLYHVSNRAERKGLPARFREAAAEADLLSKRAEEAGLARTWLQIQLAKAETLLRIAELPEAEAAVRGVLAKASLDSMRAEASYLEGKIAEERKSHKRAFRCFRRALDYGHESLVFRVGCYRHMIENCLKQGEYRTATELLPILEPMLASVEGELVHERFADLKTRIDAWGTRVYQFAPEFHPAAADLDIKLGFVRYLAGLIEVDPSKLVDANNWRRLTNQHPEVRVPKRDVERWVAQLVRQARPRRSATAENPRPRKARAKPN